MAFQQDQRRLTTRTTDLRRQFRKNFGYGANAKRADISSLQRQFCLDVTDGTAALTLPGDNNIFFALILLLRLGGCSPLRIGRSRSHKKGRHEQVFSHGRQYPQL